MKFLKLIFFALISASLFMSCGDDPLSETIVDTTWEVFSFEQTDCNDPTENIALTTVDNNCINWNSTTLCNFTYQFLANGIGFYQYTETSGLDKFDFEYSVNDDINQITICEGTNDCELYNIDGANMTLTSFDTDGCIVNALFVKG